MGIRFRKSVRIAPGVRLSISKSGFGVSAGIPGARYSVHSSGRRTTTVGLPGTGISHVSTSYGGSHPGEAPSRRATQMASSVRVSGAQAAAVLPKAGFFAGAGDRRYREGLIAYLSGDKAAATVAFESALANEPKAISAHLLAALSLDDDADLNRVISHLEAVVTARDPFPDKLMLKYVPPARSEMGISVQITKLISAQVPVNLAGATMLLAEVYQLAGRLDEAIGLVHQLHEANPTDPAIRLSLADLLLADSDYEGVVEVTSGARNDDDFGVALLHMRAASLTALGHHTAALDTFRDALAKTAKRDPELLKAIRYDRALSFAALGQKAKARADFERLYAADPDYLDVRKQLAVS
jgi:tetratricopeptide (TPR) repeat protein